MHPNKVIVSAGFLYGLLNVDAMLSIEADLAAIGNHLVRKLVSRCWLT